MPKRHRPPPAPPPPPPPRRRRGPIPRWAILLHDKMNSVLLQGVHLMKANADVLAFLDKLDTYTNELADAQAVQTALLVNVQADLDNLIAGQGAGDLDPAVSARLQAASYTLSKVAAFETAQTATLQAIADKHEAPLPPPIEVPPVELPVEPPVTP